LIRIPTVSSYAWKYYKSNWVQIDAPRHFFLHSIKSIELLASEIDLRPVDIIYDSDAFQFWGSEQYLRGIHLYSERSLLKGQSKSIFSASEIDTFTKKAEDLNKHKQGDQAAFYLRK
jgi:hypothetical protein